MELVRFSTRPSLSLPSPFPNFRVQTANNPPLHFHCKKGRLVKLALSETAVSILVSSVVVGAAATILARRLKDSQNSNEENLKDCEECKGSGLCSECKGEGYVFKSISDENVMKARMSAKTAATRYTAGLPTKWTYCVKCNSARTCRICDGSGQVKL